MNAFKIALAFVLLSCPQSEGGRKKPRSKKVINFEFLEDCNEGRYDNFINNSKVLNYGSLKTVDADLHVVQSGIRSLAGRFTAKKCQAVRDRNCEVFLTGLVDMCKVFVDKDQFYSYSIQNRIHPKLKCPLKPGVYEVRNASLTAEELISLLPVVPDEYFNYHWNVRLFLFEKRKPDIILMCFNFMFKVDAVKL